KIPYRPATDVDEFGHVLWRVTRDPPEPFGGMSRHRPSLTSPMPIFKKRPKPIDLESMQQLDELVRSGMPVLVDFMQTNCQPCRTMDGIVNELAEEHVGTAHVVKVNAARVPEAFRKFK